MSKAAQLLQEEIDNYSKDLQQWESRKRQVEQGIFVPAKILGQEACLQIAETNIRFLTEIIDTLVKVQAKL